MGGGLFHFEDIAGQIEMVLLPVLTLGLYFAHVWPSLLMKTFSYEAYSVFIFLFIQLYLLTTFCILPVLGHHGKMRRTFCVKYAVPLVVPCCVGL